MLRIDVEGEGELPNPWKEDGEGLAKEVLGKALLEPGPEDELWTGAGPPTGPWEDTEGPGAGPGTGPGELTAGLGLGLPGFFARVAGFLDWYGREIGAKPSQTPFVQSQQKAHFLPS